MFFLSSMPACRILQPGRLVERAATREYRLSSVCTVRGSGGVSADCGEYFRVAFVGIADDGFASREDFTFCVEIVSV